MASKSFVVLGEAPESESEEEIDSSAAVKSKFGPRKGKIVGGEAPESDEESCDDTGSLESVSSALSATSIPSLIGEKKSSSKRTQSLLTKKLYERNISLCKNINEFVSQAAANAGNDLNSANQQLLKSQIQLQEASDTMRTANSNLSQLHSKMEALLVTPFLPLISIDVSTEEKVVK